MKATAKNPAYDQYEFYRQCKIRFNSANKDKVSVDKAGNFIYGYLNKYIMDVLYTEYQLVVMQCEVVELNNEIWVQILKRLPKYNPELGSPTTFIRCDITHAICVWVSYEKYHASPYYANRLEEVENFRLECKEKEQECTPQLVSEHLKVKISTALRYMNMLSIAVSFSYDEVCDMNQEFLFTNTLSYVDSYEISLDLRMKLKEIAKDFSKKENLLFITYIDEGSINTKKFSKENASNFGMTPSEVKKFIDQTLKRLKKLL